MKVLKIEWKHIEVNGETCDRCYDTGENLNNEIKRLKRSLEPKGFSIELKDTILEEGQTSQSNSILFNGVPIEDIIDIQVSENYCASCTDLLGKETYCRAVKFDGNDYEDIPAKAIRQAAYKILGFEKESISQKNKVSCCGDKNCCC